MGCGLYLVNMTLLRAPHPLLRAARQPASPLPSARTLPRSRTGPDVLLSAAIRVPGGGAARRRCPNAVGAKRNVLPPVSLAAACRRSVPKQASAPRPGGAWRFAMRGKSPHDAPGEAPRYLGNRGSSRAVRMAARWSRRRATSPLIPRPTPTGAGSAPACGTRSCGPDPGCWPPGSYCRRPSPGRAGCSGARPPPGSRVLRGHR